MLGTGLWEGERGPISRSIGKEAEAGLRSVSPIQGPWPFLDSRPFASGSQVLGMSWLFGGLGAAVWARKFDSQASVPGLVRSRAGPRGAGSAVALFWVEGAA